MCAASTLICVIYCCYCNYHYLQSYFDKQDYVITLLECSNGGVQTSNELAWDDEYGTVAQCDEHCFCANGIEFSTETCILVFEKILLTLLVVILLRQFISYDESIALIGKCVLGHVVTWTASVFAYSVTWSIVYIWREVQLEVTSFTLRTAQSTRRSLVPQLSPFMLLLFLS